MQILCSIEDNKGKGVVYEAQIIYGNRELRMHGCTPSCVTRKCLVSQTKERKITPHVSKVSYVCLRNDL